MANATGTGSGLETREHEDPAALPHVSAYPKAAKSNQPVTDLNNFQNVISPPSGQTMPPLTRIILPMANCLSSQVVLPVLVSVLVVIVGGSGCGVLHTHIGPQCGGARSLVAVAVAL